MPHTILSDASSSSCCLEEVDGPNFLVERLAVTHHRHIGQGVVPKNEQILSSSPSLIMKRPAENRGSPVARS